MLSLPPALSIDTAALSGAPAARSDAGPITDGVLSGAGFAATLLAAKPAADGSGAALISGGEVLPSGGNALPVQAELPLQAPDIAALDPLPDAETVTAAPVAVALELTTVPGAALPAIPLDAEPGADALQRMLAPQQPAPAVARSPLQADTTMPAPLPIIAPREAQSNTALPQQVSVPLAVTETNVRAVSHTAPVPGGLAREVLKTPPVSAVVLPVSDQPETVRPRPAQQPSAEMNTQVREALGLRDNGLAVAATTQGDRAAGGIEIPVAMPRGAAERLSSEFTPVSLKAEAVSALAPLANVAAPAATSPATVTTTPAPIGLHVADSRWGDALSERVIVMAGQKLTSADIRLNPAELGPVRVEIRLDDGNAQVNFSAHHAVTREAIEQALPRLRELLSAEGLNLTGADVSEEGVRHDKGDDAQGAVAGGGESDDSGDEPGTEAAATTERVSEGLVDTFA